MYNVLLVDDEQLDLEALKQLVPWGPLGMEVVGTAKNGYAALQFLDEQSVDIMITDIRMPMMSGIEMAQAGRQRHADLKIVFLSGYEDFQYARKAIEMQASSYVLKPVDDAELLSLLGRIKEELDREREQLQIKDQWNASIPIVKNDLLCNWLDNHELERTLSGLRSYGIDWSGPAGCAAVIEVDDLAWKLKGYPEEYRAKMLQDTIHIVEEWSASVGQMYCCSLDRHRIGLIFINIDQVPVRLLEDLVEEVRERSPLTITAGLGHMVECGEEIPASYREAIRALASKMFLGKSRVITSEQAEGDVSRRTEDLDNIFEAMFAATASYNLVGVHDCLHDLFLYVHSLRNKISIVNFAMYVFSKVEHYLRSMHVDVYDMLDIQFQNFEILHEMETIADIETWLRKKLFEISERLHDQKQKPNRKIVQDIEQYMDERLGSNITLRDAANHFAFSPNYLGYLFKQETGENFTDVLVRKRLEKAKELLSDPKLKVYEVADKVGYKNLTYFGRHFKNHFGVSPVDYRKQTGLNP